jgi:hypothetical protein
MCINKSKLQYVQRIGPTIHEQYAELQDEVEKLEKINENQQTTISELNSELDKYKMKDEKYRFKDDLIKSEVKAQSELLKQVNDLTNSVKLLLNKKSVSAQPPNQANCVPPIFWGHKTDKWMPRKLPEKKPVKLRAPPSIRPAPPVWPPIATWPQQYSSTPKKSCTSRSTVLQLVPPKPHYVTHPKPLNNNIEASVADNYEEISSEEEAFRIDCARTETSEDLLNLSTDQVEDQDESAEDWEKDGEFPEDDGYPCDLEDDGDPTILEDDGDPYDLEDDPGALEDDDQDYAGDISWGED